MRLLALVDCDNFYASCERVFRPDLKKTPIVVLSNNDGCVIARSREAKAMALASLLLAITHPSLLDSTTIGVFFKSGRKTLSHEA